MVLFARSDVKIARPSTGVGEVLSGKPAGWLADAIERAGRDSAEFLQMLGASGADSDGFAVLTVVKKLKVVPVDGGLAVAVAVDWMSAILPPAEVDLEAMPLGSTSTCIELSARFAVSMWEVPDQALIEATQRYTRRLAEQIRAQLMCRLPVRPEGGQDTLLR